jgi:hypothetical protein
MLLRTNINSHRGLGVQAFSFRMRCDRRGLAGWARYVNGPAIEIDGGLVMF